MPVKRHPPCDPFSDGRGTSSAASPRRREKASAGVARVSCLTVVGLLLALVIPEASSSLEPSALVQANTIRLAMNPRYAQAQGPALVVTEASSTGVVESFTLFTPTPEGARVVPADNGIYFAICPLRAVCPYPGRRLARPVAAYLPRRLALELAVRTFLETTANLVAVSLPTRSFRLLIVQREELAQEVDLSSLSRALAGNPMRFSAELNRVVVSLTRPRIFVPLGLDATATGGDTFPAMQLWP
jgi:hypothetical protein